MFGCLTIGGLDQQVRINRVYALYGLGTEGPVVDTEDRLDPNVAMMKPAKDGV
jgi:hypothetical protein